MPTTSLKTERIAIVGGGINGIMTAWALCDRGYSVDVYERGDLMRETSAASSRMLHGGLRYLAKLRFHMVREALLERKWWRDQNTGMVREFLAHIPVRRGNLQELFIFGAGVMLYSILALGSGFAHSRWVPLKTLRERFPELDSSNLIGAWGYTDAIMDDRGLGIWAANQLQNRGIKFFTNTPVVSIHSNGITLQTGQDRPYDAVVNAAGPWAADLITASKIKSKNNIGLMLVRGSHLVLKRSIEQAVVLPHINGRILFLLPWAHGEAIFGTTEALQESPNSAEISAAERTELIDAYNKWFKDTLGPADILSEYSGLRPIVKQDGGTSGASREAVIGMSGGVVTIYGGKWTTSRQLGRKTADAVEYLIKR
jgi:glycerol-3-phosphate dehydrogenase